MGSPRKLIANRSNALQSTGPKTPHGKAVSAKNALKHGLLSREIVIPGEDRGALSELGNRLRTELQPAGELETLLVERITGAFWRLRRCGRVEAEMFALEVLSLVAKDARQKAKTFARRLFATETPEVSNWEDHKRATEKAEEADALGATATLGAAFVHAATEDAFSKLSRYEVTVERSLFRNLHELQRLQAARRGHSVPPTVAVDVDVGVDGP